MQVAFNKATRADALKQRRKALDQYETAMNECARHAPWSGEEAQNITIARTRLAEARYAEDDYFDRLPRVTMACCPFDGEPLYRTFDPFGLDGLWWRGDAVPEEAPACMHFCMLQGAVHFNGLPPSGGDFDAHAGPEVPYVIPRILNMPGVFAVISQLPMECGYTAYPIAYFAEKRPPVQRLTGDWPRTNFTYVSQLGLGGWRVPNDEWDFDLMPYLESGKLRWCPPGSDCAFLATELPEECPFLNLAGERKARVVRGDRIVLSGLPNGEPLWPSVF